MTTIRQKIHQTASLSSLSGLKEEIVSEGWDTATENFKILLFTNHIGREFNKKCILFDNLELMFSPYDAGFRPLIAEHPDFHLKGINGDNIETIDGSHLVLI